MKAIERQGQPEEMPEGPAIVSFSESMRDKILSLTKDSEEEKSLQVLPDNDDLVKYMQEREITRMARCISVDCVLVYQDGKTEKMNFEEWRKLWNI